MGLQVEATHVEFQCLAAICYWEIRQLEQIPDSIKNKYFAAFSVHFRTPPLPASVIIIPNKHVVVLLLTNISKDVIAEHQHLTAQTKKNLPQAIKETTDWMGP